MAADDHRSGETLRLLESGFIRLCDALAILPGGDGREASKGSVASRGHVEDIRQPRAISTRFGQTSGRLPTQPREVP